MTKKLFLKNNNYLLDDDTNDENETVEWIEETENKKYFDCGCCEECLCDNNIPCKNCGCNCNGEDIDEEYSEGSEDEEIEIDIDDDNDDDDNNNTTKKV